MNQDCPLCGIGSKPTSDETTSHSTRLSKDASQVAGYNSPLCEHPLRGLPAYPTSGEEPSQLLP